MHSEMIFIGHTRATSPEGSRPLLRGLITEADLPQAEQEWPGLQEFYLRLPLRDRPVTFLELVWRFECACDRRRRSTAA